MLSTIFLSDVLQSSPVPIDTYVDGYTSGAMTLIALSGSVRFVTRHGLIALPVVPDDEIVAEYVKRLVLEFTDLTPRQLEYFSDRQEWLEAEAALYFDCVDRLL